MFFSCHELGKGWWEVVWIVDGLLFQLSAALHMHLQ